MKFYVYAHKTISPRKAGEVFYIGKGQRRRAWLATGRNPHWQRVASKYGFSVIILADGLSEKAAFDLEKSIILICGRAALCNLTDGGEGISGASEEICRKISERHKGKPKSAQHKQKIAASHKGIRPSEETRVRLRARRPSEETRAKLSASQKARNITAPSDFAERSASMRKAVTCSNGMIFDSVSAAATWARKNGFPKAATSNISNVCNGHRPSACGGLTWAFVK